MMFWFAVLVSSIGAFVLKFMGYLIPVRFLEHPRMQFVIGLLPIGLLAGLIVQQTFASGHNEILIDGRLLGAGIAIVASARKWPFISIVFIAAAATATARYFGLVA